jgi:hypothetical protein
MTKAELLEKLEEVDDNAEITLVDVRQDLRSIKSVYLDTEGNAYISAAV